MVPITPIRMVCRLTLWHCCARACFDPICCSVALASCCSDRVSSQYFTSMRCTSQREGCIACMSLWWPFFVSTGSMQIASGIEQDQCSSADRFGRSHWGKVLLATCAGKTRLCWAIRVALPISIKMMFPPKSPLLKFWWWAWKQCYVFQSPCFELKHSDCRKAYGFGCLADDTTGKMNQKRELVLLSERAHNLFETSLDS